MDPDTGMLVCMIADGDGFRPAHAAQEFQSIELAAIHAGLAPSATPSLPDDRAAEFGALDEFHALDLFVNHYERCYGAQTPSSA